jgi:hypothetical protein
MPPKKIDIIKSIEARMGVPDLARELADRLTGSELNSLLLEVFDQRTRGGSPEQLLRQYMTNRFVQPAATDMIGSLELELDSLLFLRDCGFQPLELSPVAQFGSCSVVGTVSQDKIVSAVRNTEVVADATNSLALHIAGLKKNNPAAAAGLIRFCTVHRHLRAQELKVKWHTAHFKIGCMVTAGKDTGDYRFECSQLKDQLRAVCGLLRQWGVTPIRVKLQRREGYTHPERLLQAVAGQLKTEKGLPEIAIDEKAGPNNYYKGVQFKLIVEANGQEAEIADGGLTDWTQQLLGNSKERLLICGFGLDLLYKLRPAAPVAG